MSATVQRRNENDVVALTDLGVETAAGMYACDDERRGHFVHMIAIQCGSETSRNIFRDARSSAIVSLRESCRRTAG